MTDFITLSINNESYKLKKSFRGLMLFEEMTGQNVAEMQETTGNTLKLFYCLLKASNVETFKYSFDEFLDILDNNESLVFSFNNYLVSLSGNNKQEQKKIPKKGKR